MSIGPAFLLILPILIEAKRIRLIKEAAAGEDIRMEAEDIRLAEASERITNALSKINKARFDIGMAQDRLEQVGGLDRGI